jgi:hypothetical protein
MTASISAAYAAPKSVDQTSAQKAQDARATLALMDQQVATVSDTAFTMNQAIYRDVDDTGFQADELTDLKGQVNGIGREMAVIEAERDSIPMWQADAVEQILPIMHEIAVESTQAINTAKANGNRLFASDYVIQTNEIFTNANKAAQLLHDDIKLANARAKEDRLTASIDELNRVGTK